MTPQKPFMTPSHLDTVEIAKPSRTFHDTAEALHVTVETFYDTVEPSGLSFSQRATKQPISHRGSWGAQTGPGTFRRQLISIIMNNNQPWTTLGLAPQHQRENCDPNGSQGPANFH